jgi:hypothetical protein
MIPRLDKTLIDLGKDSERIGMQDAERQSATVNHVLRAFFSTEKDRREIQILADEVGMGKTFVALATAYTILSVLRDPAQTDELDDLRNSYKCVLVVTPGGNPTLADKWYREDEALLTRCSLDQTRTAWFRSTRCASPDQLLQAIYKANDLRRRNEPVILVMQSNVFTKRLSDPAVRFVTACLFRWWGAGLQMKERYHLARGLADTKGSWDWELDTHWAGAGEYEIDLWNWSHHERFLDASERERMEWEPGWERRYFKEVSVTYSEMANALDGFARNGGQQQLEDLRERCKQVPLRRPIDRRTAEYGAWQGWFYETKDAIRDVFKRLWPYLLAKKFPFVIIDEAHHWRHNETGEFRAVREFIAPFTKRMLLLTATPFQLDPEETTNVLNVIEHMVGSLGRQRVEALQSLKTQLAADMRRAVDAGKAFSKEWGALADQFSRVDPVFGPGELTFEEGKDPRMVVLQRLWANNGTTADEAREDIPVPLRAFFKRANDLKRVNLELQKSMSRLVIRHRRHNEHRRYWIGRSYPPLMQHHLRPDYNRLHYEPGQHLEPRDELVQYLLMKVVAQASKGRRKTALGTAITGCFTTLWESKEGRNAIAAAASDDQHGLLRILKNLTGSGTQVRDREHPKVRRVIGAVMNRWEKGEKSLIFCFRVPTAQVLYNNISKQIEHHVSTRKRALFKLRGTEVANEEQSDKAMQQFRRSLTARESSGVTLFVDRVLLGWLQKLRLPKPSLSEEDIRAISILASKAAAKGRPLFSNLDRPDRVFLSRAVEHVLAKRFAKDLKSLVGDLRLSDRQLTEQLLEMIADESWVRYRYGRPELSKGYEATEGEATERVAQSSLGYKFELKDDNGDAKVDRLTEEMLSRFRRRRDTVLSGLIEGVNLFAPPDKTLNSLDPLNRLTALGIRDQLFALTQREGQWNWHGRREAVDALVRALLRDDILFRLPLEVFKEQDETWAERIFFGLHQPINTGVTGETLAQRVEAFLKELSRMSDKERESYLEYAMNPKAEAAVLVEGSTKAETRNAIFSGFNTPLLPEVLICTSVGQEGIDLHRECRNVVHYDLGWNPATIEQRTGRTDRIGSKAERERRLAQLAPRKPIEALMPGLDIGLPYLAATYDERMYDVLRTRAQIFEILTGGDPTVDFDSETGWTASDDEGKASSLSFVTLPQELLDDLRVDLSVDTRD